MASAFNCYAVFERFQLYGGNEVDYWPQIAIEVQVLDPSSVSDLLFAVRYATCVFIYSLAACSGLAQKHSSVVQYKTKTSARLSAMISSHWKLYRCDVHNHDSHFSKCT